MTDQLGLYNRALRHLGERRLATLTDDQEARYYLDLEYPDALLYCLRGGLWNFAIRGAKIDLSSTVVPTFGYQNAIPKPGDWVRTVMLSPSEFFDPVLMDYQDQTGYWLTNLTPIYAKYVSSASGLTPANFPPDYSEYVGYYLASLILPRITQKSQAEIEAFGKRVDKARKVAAANDAMDGPPTRLPHGDWVTSRSRRGGQSQFPFNF